MTIPNPVPFPLRLALLAAAAVLLPLHPSARAQESTRIWARVGTAGGEIHEGFLRWDRNEASWVDLLNGSKPLEWEDVKEWVPDSALDVTSRDRVIEYGGYRITWNDASTDFPTTAESGIRMGHLRRMEITGDQEARLVLKSGEGEAMVTMNEDPVIMHPAPGVTVILESGSTDLGNDMRELLVDVPGGDVVELAWEELSWVEFAGAPAEARARHRRLFGTVEDRRGNRFTGAISWDNDEAFTADTLDGEDENGREREIPFSQVLSVRPRGRGAEVSLVGGEELFLSGSNDVDDDNRGIQISDPGLGSVEVDWDELESVTFHEPDPSILELMTYDAFDGGHPLQGTVVTYTGEELTGWIRWDADEELSWEILDSYQDGVTLDIELSRVASVERASKRDVLVTLLDGRVMEAGGSNDVDEDNKGILVMTPEREALEDPDEPKWIRVRWDDVAVVHFHHHQR